MGGFQGFLLRMRPITLFYASLGKRRIRVVLDVLGEVIADIGGDQDGGNQGALLCHLQDRIGGVGYVGVLDLGRYLPFDLGITVLEFRTAAALFGETHPPTAVLSLTLDDRFLATSGAFPAL